MSNWPCFSSMNGVHTLGESQGLGGVHTQVNSMPVVFMPMGGGGMSGAGIAWLVSSFRVFSFTFHCPLEQSLNLLSLNLCSTPVHFGCLYSEILFL